MERPAPVFWPCCGLTMARRRRANLGYIALLIVTLLTVTYVPVFSTGLAELIYGR